jgi:GNAT superfamily N-acetyltransferase
MDYPLENISQIGELALGSRLSRLSDQLYSSMDKAYKATGVGLQSRWFPVVYNLFHSPEPLAITDIAKAIGQSHASVSQVTKALLDNGIVTCRSDSKDERKRLIELSEDGRARCRKASPLWQATRTIVEDLLGASQGGLLGNLGALEDALTAESLDQRITKEHKRITLDRVEIIPYDPAYRAEFKRLNVEWLEEYFYVEAIDEEVLSNPEKYVLEPGGEVFFASLDDDIVGTCGVMPRGSDTLLLVRMGVSKSHQNLGVGRKLLAAAIEWYEASDASLFYLESNSRLEPAIRLYESMGFQHTEPPEPSIYGRTNVYMAYKP